MFHYPLLGISNGSPYMLYPILSAPLGLLLLTVTLYFLNKRTYKKVWIKWSIRVLFVIFIFLSVIPVGLLLEGILIIIYQAIFK
jgi:hypothetical protein